MTGVWFCMVPPRGIEIVLFIVSLPMLKTRTKVMCMAKSISNGSPSASALFCTYLHQSSGISHSLFLPFSPLIIMAVNSRWCENSTMAGSGQLGVGGWAVYIKQGWQFGPVLTFLQICKVKFELSWRIRSRWKQISLWSKLHLLTQCLPTWGPHKVLDHNSHQPLPLWAWDWWEV